jgi:hypothetical protein
MAPDRDSLISRPSYQLRATAREQSRAFFVEGFDHEPATKLAIIGLGVTVLMLLGVAALMLWRS